MLRRCISLAAIALLFAVIVSGFLWVGTSAPSYNDCYNAQKAEPKQGEPRDAAPESRIKVITRFLACEAHFADENNGLIASLATVIIATFTIVLAHSTRRQAHLTRIVAEAAHKSAEALPSIERAYLFMVLYDWVCDPGAHYSTGSSQERIHGGKFYARYGFVNHGKTPAVIKEIRIGTKRSADPLDATEWAGCGNILPRERVVPGSGGETPVYDIDDDWLSNSEADMVVAGGLFIYFFGCATYIDVFGEDHQTQFCFRYCRDSVAQWGNDEHNHRT